MQADIRDALRDKYGFETDFPSWTKPFLHAVGIMNKLANIEEETRGMGSVGDADTATEASEAGEEGDEDAGSDDGASLLSVSGIIVVRNGDADIFEKKTPEEKEEEVKDVQALVDEAEQNLLSVSSS
jgi:hypothetical protein